MAGFNPKSINIGVGLDLKGIQTGVQQMQREMGKISGTMSSISNTFKNIGIAAAAAFSVQGIAAYASEAMNLAAQAEGVRRAFEALNEPNLLANLRAATRGTVSDLDLMKAAVQAQNFKIPLDQLATYFKFAQRRARETGESVDYLVQSIITGLGRESVMILDNLGLSAKDIRDRMAAGGSMAEAVGAIISESMGNAAEHTETAADKIDRYKATLINLKETIGGKILPIVARLADGLNNFINNFSAGWEIMGQYIENTWKVAINAIEISWSGFVLGILQGFKLINSAGQSFFKFFGVTVGEGTARFLDTTIKGYENRISDLSKRQYRTISDLRGAFFANQGGSVGNNGGNGGGGGGAIPHQFEKIQMQAKLTGDAIRFEIGSIPATLKEVGNDLKAPFGLIDEQFHNFVASVRAAVAEFSALMLVDFASAIGEALVVGNDSFKDFGQRMLDNMGRFFKQIGSMFVAYGVANLEFMKTLLVPANAPALIAAGLALAAIGGAISATAKNYAEQNGTMSSSVSGTSGAFYSETRIDGYDLVTINARNNHLRTRRG